MTGIDLRRQDRNELAEIKEETEESSQERIQQQQQQQQRKKKAKEIVESEEIVLGVYGALASGDGESVRRVVRQDLEWWFHGPRSAQFLMRMLTGAERLGSFVFVPLRLCDIGEKVFVEGRDTASKLCWVHVWTVVDGVITELREYFNTSLTVTGLESSFVDSESSPRGALASVLGDSEEVSTLWESELSGRSLPGCVLAIY